MDEAQIRSLVQQLDTKSSLAKDRAWMQLRDLDEVLVPYLLEFYPQTKTWQGRCALVFYSIRFAPSNAWAFQLGVLALNDRATLVRYRACELLATSFRTDAIPHLQSLLSHRDKETVADAAAAIRSIQEQDFAIFAQRKLKGLSFLDVKFVWSKKFPQAT